jgi:hypothetical protein
MRFAAIFWPIVMAVGIFLCVMFGATSYDFPISSMPSYNSNTKLREYLDTPQFPDELAFDFKRYGLSRNEFYPKMRDYTFYSCYGWDFRYWFTSYVNGDFTIYSNLAGNKGL